MYSLIRSVDLGCGLCYRGLGEKEQRLANNSNLVSTTRYDSLNLPLRHSLLSVLDIPNNGRIGNLAVANKSERLGAGLLIQHAKFDVIGI
jgi:hypothetical protein